MVSATALMHRLIRILLVTARHKINHPLSSMDSDLEAFSHNPTDDSFAVVPAQAAAITNDLNERFLSY